MPHYVFTRTDRDDPDMGQIVAVTMGVSYDRAIDIARQLTRDLQASGELRLGYEIRATEVEAYRPRPHRPGDFVTGAEAIELPVGTIVIHLTDLGDTVGQVPLIRQGGGFVRVNGDGLEPIPVIGGARYKILHIGGTTH
jgi:hypothetical protein